MNLDIKYIPRDVGEWDVIRAVAQVLHSEEFDPREAASDRDKARLTNFQVKLNIQEMGTRNDGTGTLTLPTSGVGFKFHKYCMEFPVKINGKKIKLYRSKEPPPRALATLLDKTPYTSPDLEEDRDNKVKALQEELRVDVVQFGVFYRESYPTKPGGALAPRSFSVEWEKEYWKSSTAWMKFEYDNKLIRIELGNKMTDQVGYHIIVSFASINKMGIGMDGRPYVCFDTYTPPVFERIDFNRALTGDFAKDDRKYKHRIGALEHGHDRVSPYAPKLRLLLYHDPHSDMLQRFEYLCGQAGIAPGIILDCSSPARHIEASGRNFFKGNTLFKLRKSFASFTWPVAFQLELLLHNGLLITPEIEKLVPEVKVLCAQYPDDSCRGVGELLRRYTDNLQDRAPQESPAACFARTKKSHFSATAPRKTLRGNFLCCHVTVAPTRLILEGPYATQSNRVIREYEGYEDNFIRVDFRDEDRLQYRWTRQVDGSSFVHSRAGGALKDGLELGGKHFQFLAYSNSALREHAVWFMNPFDHPKKGRVTPDFVRNSLGVFNYPGPKFAKLLYQPSKYAARLAQGFSATDPSVLVKRNEWEEAPDLGQEPYMFTDGVGTISKALGDRIWDALCQGKPGRKAHTIQPSAYQIRFLGFKGIVGVDLQLDQHPSGIKMRLRTSMKKFHSKEEDEPESEAGIEIARAFELPNTTHLNRPLITILEDRGVRREALKDLQDRSLVDVYTINDSIKDFRNVVRSHGFGTAFHLAKTLTRLASLSLDITAKAGKGIKSIETPFLRQLRQTCMMDVLREIKHSARISVPDSYLLVGVTDEGPAYQGMEGYENVFCLQEDEIYACIQRPDEQRKWISGSCTISRSPVVHPGDVQTVRAIGEPPKDKLCLFAHMTNVVVFPSVGRRSLPSCLAGGDLDGDLYDVIPFKPLMPTLHVKPAQYPPGDTKTLGNPSTVNDICDFIIEYINSDVLGLLSDRLLVIADQSKHGIFDKDCEKLAQLCTQAVDYPKQGIPVDLDYHRLPAPLMRCKPDWHAAEVIKPRETDYYESHRALGHLFRAITIKEPEPISGPHPPRDPLAGTISELVRPYILPEIAESTDLRSEIEHALFPRYAAELRYIGLTHTVSNTPGTSLIEAEIVAGTILSKCSQRRWRKDRVYRMKRHVDDLVQDIRRELIVHAPISKPADTEDQRQSVKEALSRAFVAWEVSFDKRTVKGGYSFSLLALDIILDSLESLGFLFPREIVEEEGNDSDEDDEIELNFDQLF